jgi:hypothetical protein
MGATVYFHPDPTPALFLTWFSMLYILNKAKDGRRMNGRALKVTDSPRDPSGF